MKERKQTVRNPNIECNHRHVIRHIYVRLCKILSFYFHLQGDNLSLQQHLLKLKCATLLSKLRPQDGVVVVQCQALYLVKLFIKLAELGDFLHDLLPHEERSVEHGVFLVVEDPQGIIDKRLLKKHQRPLNSSEK